LRQIRQFEFVRQFDGQFLRRFGLHLRENGAQNIRLHAVSHCKQNVVVQIVEDASGILRLHRGIRLHQRIDLLLLRRIVLLQQALDLRLQLFQISDFAVDPVFGRRDQFFAHLHVAFARVEFGAAFGQACQHIHLPTGRFRIVGRIAGFGRRRGTGLQWRDGFLRACLKHEAGRLQSKKSDAKHHHGREEPKMPEKLAELHRTFLRASCLSASGRSASRRLVSTAGVAPFATARDVVAVRSIRSAMRSPADVSMDNSSMSPRARARRSSRFSAASAAWALSARMDAPALTMRGVEVADRFLEPVLAFPQRGQTALQHGAIADRRQKKTRKCQFDNQ
jgi:hypothetical protein